MTVTRGATASVSNRIAETSSVAAMAEEEMLSGLEEEEVEEDCGAEGNSNSAEEYQVNDDKEGDDEDDSSLEADPLPKTKRSRKASSSVASKWGKTKGGKTVRRVTSTRGMPPRFRHARPLPPRVEPPSADLLDPLSFPQRHNATQKL